MVPKGGLLFDLDIAGSPIRSTVERMLDQHSILLTTVYSRYDIQAVIDNEHNSLMYGVYNLGFWA